MVQRHTLLTVSSVGWGTCWCGPGSGWLSQKPGPGHHEARGPGVAAGPRAVLWVPGGRPGTSMGALVHQCPEPVSLGGGDKAGLIISFSLFSPDLQ